MARSVTLGLALFLGLVVMRPATEVAAAPTAISNCATITTPGSFVLSKNLTPTKGDCLVVAADFVTIDFAGFAIVGNNTGDGVTDLNHAPPHRGIVIRKGTVENCKRGVYLANSIWSVVEGMRVIGNSGTGITANAGSVVVGNVVVGNVVVANGGDAIRVSNGIASGNLVYENGGIGIGIGSQSIVEGNAVWGSGAEGIAVSGEATVSGNVSNHNKGNGILLGFFGAGNYSTVSGNTAGSSGGVGLRIPCPSNIIGNTAQNNTGPNMLTVGPGCNRANNLPSP